TLIAFDKTKGTDERLNTVTGHLTGKDIPAKLTAIDALGAALSSMGGDVLKKRLPDIIKQLDDKELVVQAAAIATLSGFGKAAEEATPRLKEIMEQKDQNEWFRQACQKAIKDITGKEPALSPVAPKAGTGTASSGPNKPPDAIEGKTLDQWIKEIKDHTD